MTTGLDWRGLLDKWRSFTPFGRSTATAADAAKSGSDMPKGSGSGSDAGKDKKPPCKPCMACKDSKRARDECLKTKKGEQYCQKEIKDFEACLLKQKNSDTPATKK